jgi:hypothetical protein
MLWGDFMSLLSWSIDDLCERCEAETQKYFQRQNNDPQYCFELFRWLFVENNQKTFTCIYRTYEPLVRGWVRQHPWLERADETEEFFVSSAFAQFWRFARLRFENFTHLAQLLKYLKLCVHTSITAYLRNQLPEPPLPLSEIPDLPVLNDAESRAESTDLWVHICRILHDPSAQLLVQLRYFYDLKPAEIVELYPALWATARDVSIALQRIRRKLRNDPYLRGLANLPRDDSDNGDEDEDAATESLDDQ